MFTEREYSGFQEAYSHFNQELFAGGLPECLITLQRKSKARGYYCHERFNAREGEAKVDEIALNPDCFLNRSDKEILSTLVHEQVHVWQQHHGKPPRKCYHDKEFAQMMKTVGLHPSNSGLPGGKETGPSMTHYIIEGGPFEDSFSRLESSGFKLGWQSAPNPPKETKKSKLKYTCNGCGANVWAKPDVNVICGDCYEVGSEPESMECEEAA